MNQTSLLAEFGTPIDRVNAALDALKRGQGVLLLDDENRENEGDLIYSAEHLTPQQMALMIRECSGIVCLCLTDDKATQLDLPPMVSRNDSANQTAFTVSIEAKKGVTTGVSAMTASPLSRPLLRQMQSRRIWRALGMYFPYVHALVAF